VLLELELVELVAVELLAVEVLDETVIVPPPWPMEAPLPLVVVPVPPREMVPPQPAKPTTLPITDPATAQA
jgi:hypothetical protein